MKPTLLILFLIACLCDGIAQTANNEKLRVAREGTTFGLGSYRVKDTYLSPFIYDGWGGSILNDRETVINSLFSRRKILAVDISATRNPAQNINDFGTFVDYSLAYHYNVINANEHFSLMLGAAPHIMGGFIYNTYNGNNPISAKVDLDLNLSFAAIYIMNIKNRPVRLSASGMLPFAGVFFAPPYGASYYEMFSEKNTTDIIEFNSFHNKISFIAGLTADIPFGSLSLRLACLFKYYSTDVKEIQSRIVSNTFMIGWVKEFYVK